MQGRRIVKIDNETKDKRNAALGAALIMFTMIVTNVNPEVLGVAAAQPVATPSDSRTCTGAGSTYNQRKKCYLRRFLVEWETEGHVAHIQRVQDAKQFRAAAAVQGQDKNRSNGATLMFDASEIILLGMGASGSPRLDEGRISEMCDVARGSIEYGWYRGWCTKDTDNPGIPLHGESMGRVVAKFELVCGRTYKPSMLQPHSCSGIEERTASVAGLAKPQRSAERQADEIRAIDSLAVAALDTERLDWERDLGEFLLGIEGELLQGSDLLVLDRKTLEFRQDVELAHVADFGAAKLDVATSMAARLDLDPASRRRINLAQPDVERFDKLLDRNEILRDRPVETKAQIRRTEDKLDKYYDDVLQDSDAWFKDPMMAE